MGPTFSLSSFPIPSSFLDFVPSTIFHRPGKTSHHFLIHGIVPKFHPEPSLQRCLPPLPDSQKTSYLPFNSQKKQNFLQELPLEANPLQARGTSRLTRNRLHQGLGIVSRNFPFQWPPPAPWCSCSDTFPFPAAGKHQGFTAGNDRKTPFHKNSWRRSGALSSGRCGKHHFGVFLGNFLPVFGKMGGLGRWDVPIVIPFYPWKNNGKRLGGNFGRNSLVWESKKMRRGTGKIWERGCCSWSIPRVGFDP